MLHDQVVRVQLNAEIRVIDVLEQLQHGVRCGDHGIGEALHGHAQPVPLCNGQTLAVTVHQGIPVLLVAVVGGHMVSLLDRRCGGVELPGGCAAGHRHQRGDNPASDPLCGLCGLLEVPDAVLPFFAAGVVPRSVLEDEHVGFKADGAGVIPQRPAGFLREEFIQCFRGSQIVHALEAEFTDLIRDSDQRVPMRHILRDRRPTPGNVCKFHVASSSYITQSSNKRFLLLPFSTTGWSEFPHPT